MEADTPVSRALAVLRAELEQIPALPGSENRAAAIRALAPLPELAEMLSGLRRAEVLRLRREEMFSLGKAAGRVGISKARADQYERDAKKQEARDGQRVHDGR